MRLFPGIKEGSNLKDSRRMVGAYLPNRAPSFFQVTELHIMVSVSGHKRACMECLEQGCGESFSDLVD